MLTPTNPPVARPTRPTPEHQTPTDPLACLAGELRALYTETFRHAHKAAETARARFETPDGTGPLDPRYAADAAACRAVNRHLHTIVGRWLPGAQLVDRIDEPAVIDSRWLHQQRTIAIGWDHAGDFGDPEALTIEEVVR